MRGRIPYSLNSKTYRFLADFFDRDFFEPDDLELLFDAPFLLARALFCAVDADFVFEADFFDDFEPERCLRAFSASICSPRVSISSAPNAELAFLFFNVVLDVLLQHLRLCFPLLVCGPGPA